MNTLRNTYTGNSSIAIGQTALHQSYKKERSLDSSSTNYVEATYTSASSLV